MIELIFADSAQEWDALLSEFPKANIYYTREYCKAFSLHGDGKPAIVLYKDDCGLTGILVIMIRDLADCSIFQTHINKGVFFDAVTPYGYGGFLFNRRPSEYEQDIIAAELKQTLSAFGVISLFIRFCPVLANVEQSRQLVSTFDLGHTIAMDLENHDVIWSNITSKNRNVIRRAEKNGVVINSGIGEDLMNKFIPIYESTMTADRAEDYYYFNREFYNSILKDLEQNHRIFYAEYNGLIISMAIIIFKNNQMEYHLSGSLKEYRNLGAGNLLLYKAALWGSENGFQTFHLGGGIGSGEDSLYKFKAAFNRNSNHIFSIGKLIIDQEKYDYLTALRMRNDSSFNHESKFFPLYRS